MTLSARLLPAVFGMALCVAAPAAHAASVTVDLGTWQGDGAPWILSAGNNTATQNGNAPTAVLSSGLNDLFGRYTGTLGVRSSADDDFIGVVVGYTPGDLSAGTANANIDYILVDWKQAAQTGAPAGMAVSHVTGNIFVDGNSNTITTGSNAWRHTGPVQEIKRANTRGSTGWADNTVYSFQADYLPNLFRFYINGTLEIELTPSEIGQTAFTAGSFGFYAFSQEKTEFAAIQYESLSTIPLPAGLPLLLAGLGGLALARRRKAA